MKLFVFNKSNQKVYIDLVASSRIMLSYRLGGNFFNINGEVYHVNQTYAENDTNDTVGGTIVGGIVGLLGGPIGLLAGGIIGGLIGNSKETNDRNDAIRYNNSHL